MSLQFDLLELSLIMVKYSNKKTLNKVVLLSILSYFVSEELALRIKLQFDSNEINGDLESNIEEQDEEQDNEDEDEDDEQQNITNDNKINDNVEKIITNSI